MDMNYFVFKLFIISQLNNDIKRFKSDTDTMRMFE